jgi:DNA-directed RNA polymerase specialized sigma24 family protein
MSSPGSVTYWIRQLKAGNHEAAQRLWERYFLQLVALARKKRQTSPRLESDEEDVTLSAFDNFCLGAAAGRLPRLDDQQDLWKFLVLITARKVIQLVKQSDQQQRGGESFASRRSQNGQASSPNSNGLEQIVGPTPTPAFAVQVSEEYQRLLDLLNDSELRNVAVWKLEGHTTAEIARKLGCIPRSVERKLRVIRSLWNGEEQP